VSSLLVLTAVRRLDAQIASPATALPPQAGAVPCQGHDVIASGGTPLPGAAIAIKDAVRTVAVTSTDVDGSYAFALSPGLYNVLSQCGLRAPRLRRFSRIAEGHFVDTTDSIQRHFVEPWKARFPAPDRSARSSSPARGVRAADERSNWCLLRSAARHSKVTSRKMWQKYGRAIQHERPWRH
jgi:hypothetical protein